MLHYFCRLQNIEDFRSQIKGIWQPNNSRNVQRLGHVKRLVPNRSETSGSALNWIFESGGNYFLLCAVIWMLKGNSVLKRPISRADLHLIYSNVKWFAVLSRSAQAQSISVFKSFLPSHLSTDTLRPLASGSLQSEHHRMTKDLKYQYTSLPKWYKMLSKWRRM